MKKQILMIGAGKRAQGTLLPAVACIRNHWNLAGVVARSSRRLTLGKGLIDITTTDDLEGVDLARIDSILMAVPVRAVPRVLASITRQNTTHITLCIDTPVLHPADLRALRFFRRFKAVRILEDTLAHPPFLLARRLIDEGAIGKLQSIFLFHSGFKHHGIAGIKMLCRTASVDSMVSRSYIEKRMQKILHLGDVRAVMYEPRDYHIGKFLIQGTGGCIADDDHPGDRVQRIGYAAEDGMYAGLTLNGEPVTDTANDALYRATMTPDRWTMAPMEAMKVRALIDLFMAVDNCHTPMQYAPLDGITDNLAILLSEKLGWVPSQRFLAHLCSVRAAFPW